MCAGDFAVLLKAGMSAKQAVCYNMLSSALCFLGMLLGVSLGHSEDIAQWVFAAAAGMFLYIALVDMVRARNNTLCWYCYFNAFSLFLCFLRLTFNVKFENICHNTLFNFKVLFIGVYECICHKSGDSDSCLDLTCKHFALLWASLRYCLFF